MRQRSLSGLTMFLPVFYVLALMLAASAAEADENADDPKAAAEALALRMKSKDLEERAAAVEAALDNLDGSLTSPLLRRLQDKSSAVRVPAMAALAVRTSKSDRRKAASAISGRLARLDEAKDKDEALAALAALQTLAEPGPIKDLIKGIENDSDEDLMRARLMAIAVVPDEEAVDRLIQFLSKGGRRGGLRKQRVAASDALRVATGQRFGQDPDKWRAWWKEVKRGFDFDGIAQAREQAAADAKAKRDRKGKGKGKGKKGKGRKGKKTGSGAVGA